MNRSIHRISLDIHKVGSQTALNVKKGDTARSICITLTENGRPYEIHEECSAVFNAKKPDGNFILNDCVIQGNEIVYDFTPQTAPVAGAMECEVSLYDKAGNQITSPRFLIVVDEVVYNGEEIISTPESDVLKELINEANSVIDEVENKLANGEFVGEKGEKGDKGDKGDAGVDGTEGQDGVSATHEWNGTVLTVTSASGTSSADLKGEPGNDGYTPIKGVDYWTDSEQAEILAKSAPSIVCQASGDVITLSDSSDLPLRDLKVYGKTTQASTPSPENPQALESPTEVVVKTCGKNLIPFPYMTADKTTNGITFTVQNDGGVRVVGTATGDAFFNLCKYRFSDVSSLQSNSSGVNTDGKIVISGGVDVSTKVAYQTHNDLTYIVVAKGAAVDTVIYPQIEYGTTPTEYEPYTGQSLALPILNEVGLAGVPIASGGNYTDANGQQWVCDEVDFKRGVYVQRVGSVDLGALTYGQSATSVEGQYRFAASPLRNEILTTVKVAPNDMKVAALSTGFVVSTASALYSGSYGIAVGKDGDVYIRGKQLNDLTTDEVKAAVSGFMFYYELAEPVEIPLDEATLSAFSALHTNKPNTTIANDSGVWMSAEYVADTKLYIDNKFAELAAAIVSNS